MQTITKEQAADNVAATLEELGKVASSHGLARLAELIKAAQREACGIASSAGQKREKASADL